MLSMYRVETVEKKGGKDKNDEKWGDYRQGRISENPCISV